jgi:membrane protease subunit (stomatin/prohibitin family)
MEDPKYGVIVSVRAFGQFGFRVADPRKFINSIVGSSRVFTASQITDYFKGVMLSSVNSNIGKAVIHQNISLLQISAYLDEISEYCQERIGQEFHQFGLEMINFYFQSINIPEDDPSYIRLKEIKEKSAELQVVGRDVYQLDKSMAVLKTAAGNEGLSGLMMQSGMGQGMGLIMGAQMGQQAGQLMGQLPPQNMMPPPLPNNFSSQFYIVLNGQQLGPLGMEVLQQMIHTGAFHSATFVWQPGMTEWQMANTVSVLSGLFVAGNHPKSFDPPAIPTV